jgi:hypothetical protein
MMRRNEKGQALLLVVMALGIFLIGALGLAVDGAQMYGHRQMAQAAADAAAQAGIMSIFDGTAGTGASAFPTSGSFVCAAADARTPCKYAAFNKFGGVTGDVVTIDYPATSAAPGVPFSVAAPVKLIRATVQRTLNTGLIRMLGPSTSTVTAVAIAAIVDIVAPVPILVLHPTKSGSFHKNGSNTIVICGGPNRSIQVNSNSTTSIAIDGNGAVDLSHAGPLATPGNCDGLGADFGDFGGPGTYPGTLTLGTNGTYRQPASPISDVLAGVPEPALPGTLAPAPVTVASGVSGCPVSAIPTCKLYSPGRYDGGITPANKEFAIFKPGVYYLNGGGFHMNSNTASGMSTGFADDLNTGQGVVFYNAGNAANDFIEITSNSGKIQGVDFGNSLVGAPNGSIYKGILFFQQRGAATHVHSLQGGGGIQLVGTIYMTNTKATMLGDPTHYQTLSLQGNPGQATNVIGQIIVDALDLGGNANITMTLNPTSTLTVQQVALVK